MSIYDHNAATLYAAMQDETRPRPPKVKRAADLADEAWDRLHREAISAGINCPGDDRAENIIHAIFRYLVEANNNSVDDLAAVVEQTS